MRSHSSILEMDHKEIRQLAGVSKFWSRGEFGAHKTRASEKANLETHLFEIFNRICRFVHLLDYTETGLFSLSRLEGYGRETEGLVYGTGATTGSTTGVVIGSGPTGGWTGALLLEQKGALGPLSPLVSLDPEVEACRHMALREDLPEMGILYERRFEYNWRSSGERNAAHPWD
ncbi:hypothetical protein Tco_1201270 [Tanacetum coccineum]